MPEKSDLILPENDLCLECGLPGNCKHRQLGGHKKDIKHSRGRSQDQERKVASQYREVGYPKARKVPMSGGIALMKGDVEVEDFMLIECKETRTGRLTMNPEWVDKISREASAQGKQWFGLHLHVAEGENNYRKLVVIPEQLWLGMLELITQK